MKKTTCTGARLASTASGSSAALLTPLRKTSRRSETVPKKRQAKPVAFSLIRSFHKRPGKDVETPRQRQKQHQGIKGTRNPGERRPIRLAIRLGDVGLGPIRAGGGPTA